MKFDMIIGNPPYNDASIGGTGGRKQATSKLWPKFCKWSLSSLKADGDLLLIIPASALKGTTLSGFNFKQIFSYLNGLKIGIGLGSWFKGVATKNIFYHLQNKIRCTQQIDLTYYGDDMCHVSTSSISLQQFNDFIVPLKVDECNLNDIIKKVYTSGYPNLFDRSCGGLKIETAVYPEVDINGEVYLGGGNIGAHSIIFKNKKQIDDYERRGWQYKKLVMPISVAENPLYWFDNRGDKIIGTSANWCIIDDKWTLIGLQSVLKSKLFTFLIRELRFDKYTNHLKYLPKLDMSKNWTDQQIYDCFGLDEQQRRYLNEI